MTTETEAELRLEIERLLQGWREEIAGWDEAANIADRGNEAGVASRNRVRADSVRGCVDELSKTIVPNVSVTGVTTSERSVP